MIRLMQLEEAQADVLRIYRGGFSGPLVSALIWFVAAATYQWVTPGAAMTVLFLGGMLIVPLAALVLKIMGGPAFLPKGHPSTPLAIQSAATVPLGLLVAFVLGTLEPTLFFPAALIVVGAHYLTFIALYGTWLFGALAGALVAVGAIALFALPSLRAPSGWIGAAILLASAIPLYLNYRTSLAKEPRPADASTAPATP